MASLAAVEAALVISPPLLLLYINGFYISMGEMLCNTCNMCNLLKWLQTSAELKGRQTSRQAMVV